MFNEKSITQVVDTEYRSYSMYVLENRAIPSAIDGLKSVTRKLLYAMLNEHGGKKTKLVDLGSISKCVSADTIVTVNGKKTSVFDLYNNWNPGDVIKGYDAKTDSIADAKILNVCKHSKPKKLYLVEFEDGSSIKISEDHPLMTIDRSWVELKDAHVGDDILRE